MDAQMLIDDLEKIRSTSNNHYDIGTGGYDPKNLQVLFDIIRLSFEEIHGFAIGYIAGRGEAKNGTILLDDLNQMVRPNLNSIFNLLRGRRYIPESIKSATETLDSLANEMIIYLENIYPSKKCSSREETINFIYGGIIEIQKFPEKSNSINDSLFEYEKKNEKKETNYYLLGLYRGFFLAKDVTFPNTSVLFSAYKLEDNPEYRQNFQKKLIWIIDTYLLPKKT
jgi:hypothetical protein